MESALYVKLKWGTLYGVMGMRNGIKGCEWVQKERSRRDYLLRLVVRRGNFLAVVGLS